MLHLPFTLIACLQGPIEVPGELLFRPHGDPLIRHTELPAPPAPGGSSPGELPPLLGQAGQLCSGLGLVFAPNFDQIEGDTPSAVAFTPDGSRYLIAHRDSKNLIEFDTATNDFLRAIDVSGSPQDLALTPDGSTAVVANMLEGTVSFIDLASGTETTTATGFSQPAVVRLTGDGSRAVVGNWGAQELVVLDVASGAELLRVGGMGFWATGWFASEAGASGTLVEQLEVSGNTAVHPDRVHDEIVLVDVVTGTTTRLTSLEEPRGLALTPDGATAVIAHGGLAKAISVVDVASATITKAIFLNLFPIGAITVDPSGTTAVVAASTGPTIGNNSLVVDLVSGAVSPVVPTGWIGTYRRTADGNHALGFGQRIVLVEFASGAIVADLDGPAWTALGAISPTADKAVLVTNSAGEDRLVVETTGAGASISFQDTTGQGLEADATRRIAISADGRVAVTTNVLSDTATIWDVPGATLVKVVEVGDRPEGVALTPDGSLAVVANLDSTFVSVIDVATATVTQIPISFRGSEVAISPDGTQAFVATIDDGDGVWRIDLTTLTVSGAKIPTGDMAFFNTGYGYASGIALSPDGSRLAVCNTFSNSVTVLDTQAWSTLGTVAVSSRPLRAVWNAAGTTCYVGCYAGNQVARIQVGAGPPQLTGSFPSPNGPLHLALAPDEQSLVTAGGLAGMVRIALPSGAATATAPLPGKVVGLTYSAKGELLAPFGRWDFLTSSGTYFANYEGTLRFADPATLGVLNEIVIDPHSPSDYAIDAASEVLVLPSVHVQGVTFVRLNAGLVAEPAAISITSGGSQDLCLDAGVAFAGQVYLVLGSASGTAPGLTVDAVTLPLVPDPYLFWTLTAAGNAPFVGTLGVLDGLGRATAAIVLGPLLDPNLAGLDLHHAFVALDPLMGTVGFASEAVGLELAP
ncbi:YncE family protein [Engelhardtia mirabilis]|uniref:Lactonase, 7-bladed beta-propeller n=1 Tax=Engelhardtia mirabilis TaxID=2528011 RepID=A0A518BN59_9BACT|nr:Lactonase, 7-bladed beta-propeller [Planctomycetes bacterium Pla133]QDV02739.1 Lactonase, 7-bladed beta-propeller [Planctomycetes bacterium Pla86]